MSEKNYYKANILTGCRLPDLNTYMEKDSVIAVPSNIASMSRSINAALRAKWIIPILKKEIKNSKLIEIDNKKLVLNASSNAQTLDNPISAASTRNYEINNEALDRQKKREEKLKIANKKLEAPVEVDEPIEYMRKNQNVNQAAINRLKKRGMKLTPQETSYKTEIDEVNKEGVDLARKISQRMNKVNLKEVELIVDKEKIKNDIDTKLEEKLKNKKLLKFSNLKTTDIGDLTPLPKRKVALSEVSMLTDEVEPAVVKKNKVKPTEKNGIKKISKKDTVQLKTKDETPDLSVKKIKPKAIQEDQPQAEPKKRGRKRLSEKKNEKPSRKRELKLIAEEENSRKK